MLGKLFTWWNGATLGTLFTIRKRGSFVGEDEFGNKYYEERKATFDGRPRRWVTYKGYADASRVPSDWHGWLHHTFETPPSETPLPRQSWEKDHHPNLTGTLYAKYPKGSLSRGGERAKVTADYEAWSPDA